MMRRLICALLIPLIASIPGCAIEGPAEDGYKFNTPIASGEISIKRPGGPLFITVSVANGGCMWFTDTKDPEKCVGDCIQVPPGGGVYQVPAGGNVAHFSEDCSECPCEPTAPESTTVPGGDQALPDGKAFWMGSFITSTKDRDVFSFSCRADSSWTMQRAYERLRDKLDADKVAPVHEYVAVHGSKEMRRWTISIRDDDQAIADVRVTLNGRKVGVTSYEAGAWGFGAETTINLTVGDIRALIGGEARLELAWKQGKTDRQVSYRGVFQ